MRQQEILNAKAEALEEIKNAQDESALSAVRIKYLGRKKGKLTLTLKEIKELNEGERKDIGTLANQVKKDISAALQSRQKELKKAVNLEKEKIDVTVPGTKRERGHLNPITLVQREIEDIFTSMGFEIADGPELETEHYNFDVLNMPADHPARDMQDTFYIQTEGEEKLVLRTHTSNVQVRFMEKRRPPLRAIAPGRIFRNEATDARHEHTLHQFEAIVVGDDVNVGHFKYIAETFFARFFGKEVPVRIRPGHFPFTEPSFEFDIRCAICDGKGCKVCSKTGGWLEVAGAGMIHQKVLEAAGYPRNRYQGFAWGFGIERLAMLKYKIDDIRLFHGGDLRFIEQF